MSADSDLLGWVLRHGDKAVEVLRDFGSAQAANDLAWLVKVNRRDWSHEVHTDLCMSDDAEAGRQGMTAQTVAANHHLHMGHVRRIESALRSQR